MKEYKGVEIRMFEGTAYQSEGVEITSDKLFYVASSKHGQSFANQPQKALEGAQEQIDKATANDVVVAEIRDRDGNLKARGTMKKW